MVEQHCRAQQIAARSYRFSRRPVREYTRWGDTQLKIHLGRLTELEYLLVHRGGRGQSFEYELLCSTAATAHPERCAPRQWLDRHATRSPADYDAERSGCGAPQSGSGRPSVGVLSGDGRYADIARASRENQLSQRIPVHPSRKRSAPGPHAKASVVPTLCRAVEVANA